MTVSSSAEPRSNRPAGKGRVWLFVTVIGIAAISTAINRPLARFALQDLLWNDLVLASRISWLSEALTASPGARIDFTQGLGNDMRSDVKVIAHFYDPAVLLAFFADVVTALELRHLLLTCYGLACLVALYRQMRPGDQTDGPLLVPALIAFAFSPQLFFEVSHHFSAVLYALPGVVLALRAYAERPTIRTGAALAAAATLLVHLSDLHIAFLAPALAGFLWLIDARIANARRRLLAVAVLGFAAIVATSYFDVARAMIGRDKSLVANEGSWTLAYYWSAFLKPVLATLIFPTFEGPICLYVAPLVPFLLIPLCFAGRREYAGRLARFAAIVGGLVLFGAVMHGLEPLRSRLPSAMRYHLAIIPTLATLFLFYQRSPIESALASLRRSVGSAVLFLAVVGGVCYLAANRSFNPESQAFLAYDGFLMEPNVFAWRRAGIVLLAAFPLAFAVCGVLPPIRPGRWLGAVLAVVFALFTGAAYYGMRMFSVPAHNRVFIDAPFRDQLFHQIPGELERLIENSRHASAPRSFVPVARGILDPDVGRNDKLLPLLELPEMLGGRAFFHWRYSYSAQTSGLYARATGKGPINFYPPSPGRLDAALEFARLTGSPFIVAADAELNDPRLEHLGSVSVANRTIARRPTGELNEGFRGQIHLYAVVAAGAPRASYTRTTATFFELVPIEGASRLPISYFPSLTARDDHGRKIALTPSADGFVVAHHSAKLTELRVGSNSWSSWMTLLSPLIGLSILALGRGVARPT
jgi:hypothetical protein